MRLTRTRAVKIGAPWCRAAGFVCGVALAASGAPARADEPSQQDHAEAARAAFDEGSRRYDLGDYPGAIEQFETSYRLSGAHALLLNIAQAYRLEHDCDDALAFYQRFLEKEPQSAHRAEVDARIAEMRACAKASPARATTGPASAAPPATATSSASSSSPSPASTATSTTADGSGHPSSAASSADDERAAAPASGASTWRVVGWSGVGLAVTGAGVGIVGALMTLNKKADLDRACNPSGGCPPSSSGDISSYETLRAISIVGAVGAGLGIGLATLGFLEAAPRGSTSSTSASAKLYVSGTSIGLRGTFR